MAFRRHRWMWWSFFGIGVFVYCLFTYLVSIQLPRFVQLSNDSWTSSCTRKTNVFFLKTHKCASSTVQNILLRFGARQNLNFVLPTLGNYLGNQKPFHHLMTSNAPWHSLGYSIFCHHTVFSDKEVAAIMPNDTIYVSILRDPVDLFESLYSYARLDLHYKQTIEEFASTNVSLNAFRDRALGYLGLNQMSYDFGVSPFDFGNTTFFREFSKDIERRFSLIMIAEHFDESMILLKDLLCWSLDDVVYFQHNVRKVETKRRLSVDVRNNLRALNGADDYLYKYFRKVFWHKVEWYGVERMRVEVAALRKRNREFLKFCESGFAVDKKEDQHVFPILNQLVERPHSGNTNTTCEDLSLRELLFTNRLLRKQFAKAMGGLRFFGNKGKLRYRPLSTFKF